MKFEGKGNIETSPSLSLKRRGAKVIAIVGPTASGKTGIGVRLAKEFNGEIVSADSRQVFRGLDLGTGKDLAEYGDVPFHMINIVDPGEKMTLFDYLPLARAAIRDILDRGKLPIIVGGTGLYVQGIVEGFTLEQFTVHGSQFTANTREQLNNLTLGQLNNLLKEIDPEKAEKVDQKNRHRLIRAIELAQRGIRPIKVKPDFDVLQIGLDVPRKELHERIDRRVDERFKAGMLEEVIGLLDSGVSADWLMGLGLEYRVITSYILESEIRNHESCKDQTRKESCDSKFEQMRQELKYKIHQFARRQMTWFRRFPEINWLSDYSEIERFAKIFISH